ncbi:Fc.00g096050.m01.CDS01 [Cosmosporella sp. VM-42]
MAGCQEYMKCTHKKLCLDVSPHADEVGFKRPTERQRFLAATRGGNAFGAGALLSPKERFGDATTFPGPLVLPDDDIACDPEWPPQPVKEWLNEPERNLVTPQRKTIYVVASPEIDEKMKEMHKWEHPIHSLIERPQIDDICEYLRAFYHGMDVKIFPRKFCWNAWEMRNEKPVWNGKPWAHSRVPKAGKEEFIGLRTPDDEMVGIRCRATPDKVSRMQVNLDDVLDALIATMPDDAYSMIMFLDLDMYEGDDDVWTGGRAYGGSRIAVVNGFREYPGGVPVDVGHFWPSSHCVDYINWDRTQHPGHRGAKRARVASRAPQSGPIYTAIEAASRPPTHKPSPEEQLADWLARLLQTAVHELGHCSGLDHCVYYACIMQGSGSLDEAARQPPYLCPVCLEKVVNGIGEGLVKGWAADAETRKAFVRERYKKLRKFCEKWGGEKGGRMWDGYKGWLDAVLEQDYKEED